MFDTFLKKMKENTDPVRGEKQTARQKWLNEWAKLYLRAYESGRKVIYTSAYAFPGELLAAFDICFFDFELAAAMLATTDFGVPVISEGEKRKYDMNVCSFHRAALGATYMNAFPQPDLMLNISYYCDGKTKANDLIARHHGCESYLLYVPSDISAASVRYVKNQLKEIIKMIENTTGQTFDIDRLREAVKNSNKALHIQKEILDLLKQKPSPMSGREMIGYSINGHNFDGLHQKIETNLAIKHEIEYRLKSGYEKHEKHRMFWFAWITTYPSKLFEMLAAHDANVAMCETFRIHHDEIDFDDPLEGIALKCLKDPFVGSHSRRMRDMAQIIEEYDIDAAILFATPACKHSKSTTRLFKDQFATLNLPFLSLDIDICDPRGYAPEQIRTRIGAFMELLDNTAIELRTG